MQHRQGGSQRQCCNTHGHQAHYSPIRRPQLRLLCHLLQSCAWRRPAHSQESVWQLSSAQWHGAAWSSAEHQLHLSPTSLCLPVSLSPFLSLKGTGCIRRHLLRCTASALAYRKEVSGIKWARSGTLAHQGDTLAGGGGVLSVVGLPWCVRTKCFSQGGVLTAK